MEIIQQLNALSENTQTEHTLYLQLPQAYYALHSNSKVLLDELHDYFVGLVSWESQQPVDLEFKLLETQAQQAIVEQIEWRDWTREAGKSGRKDAIFDRESDSLRLLHKVKTGMLFIQPALSLNGNLSQQIPTALGPTEQHPNQIINFILTQYLNQHLRQDWLLGHAAGLQIQNKGIAVAGLSGGGKSTLMLKLLEQGEHFVSNDRLLFTQEADGTMLMRGIPKQPRINPGTIVHNERLHSLMSAEERADFLAMPTEALRALELKYDAPVDHLFWPNCYQTQANLDAMVILNWSAQSDSDTHIKTTTLAESPELIPALVKSPGPFYSDAKGHFLVNGLIPDPADYQSRLGEVKVLELRGQINFEAACDLVLQALS